MRHPPTPILPCVVQAPKLGSECGQAGGQPGPSTGRGTDRTLCQDRVLGGDRLRRGPGRLQELTCLPVIQEEAGPSTAGAGRGLDAGMLSELDGSLDTGEDTRGRPRHGRGGQVTGAGPPQLRLRSRGRAGAGPCPGRPCSGCRTAVLSRPDHASLIHPDLGSDALRMRPHDDIATNRNDSGGNTDPDAPGSQDPSLVWALRGQPGRRVGHHPSLVMVAAGPRGPLALEIKPVSTTRKMSTCSKSLSAPGDGSDACTCTG